MRRVYCLLSIALIAPAAAHEGTILFAADDGPYGPRQPIPLDRLGTHVVGLTLTDGNGTPLDGLDVRLFMDEVVAGDEVHRLDREPAPMDALGAGRYRATVDFARAADAAGVEGSASFLVVAWVYDAEGPTDDFAQIPYRHEATKDTPAPFVAAAVGLFVALALRRGPG